MIRIIRNLSQSTLVLAGLCAVLNPVAHASGISATATYAESQISPGVYQYNVTLDNTGTTTIGTFWFSWVPGAGFLSATPSAVLNPAGWSDTITNAGAAIRWTTSNDLLAGGQTLSGFEFDSTETPAQLLGTFAGTGTGAGDPVTTSFVYIGAAFGDPGFQLTATPAQTPEPESLVLTLTGCAFVYFVARRKLGRLRLPA
jgi:hypothetical protein